MEYGLIGEKLSHSFSKEIHLSLASYDYQLKELTKEEVPDFIKNKKFKAINVTIPYKETVMPYLDEISDMAKKIGCVNTIVNKNSKLYGYNTDYYGFSYMLTSAGIQVKDRIVAVLGSGGASKTIVAVLTDLGAKSILIVSRNGELNYQNLGERKDIQIIINASPVGMYPNNGNCLVNLDDFPLLEGVADIVYNPSITELLRRAKEKGIKFANGLSMLVAQAKKACELFIDTTIDDSKIEEIIKKVELETKNIVLVGMPGCGKTTIANQLGLLLDRTVVDLDIEFEKEYKITPAQCISTFGEQDFREKESVIVSKFCKESKLIISTGGGAVISSTNRDAIKQNSFVVWVKRDIEKLDNKNRPLSSSIESIKMLYETRKKYYNSVADFVVENNLDIKTAADKIVALLK